MLKWINDGYFPRSLINIVLTKLNAFVFVMDTLMRPSEVGAKLYYTKLRSIALIQCTRKFEMAGS